MKIEVLAEYGIEEDFILKFKKEGLKSLYPPQIKSIEAGLFERKNLVVSAATASGKTFVATLGALNALQKRLGKVVYIVPLVALANEKYLYFKQLFASYKIAISVGDLDSVDSYLTSYDLVVTTSEKLDSLIRHQAGWIKDLALIIADEVHLIDDSFRGATLEIVLTQLLNKLCPKAQIIALSATISNAQELAGWLKAKAIIDDFRPVKLYEGVCFNKRIKFLNKDARFLDEADTIFGIANDTLRLNKQALFFVANRRSAESLAEKLSTVLREYLNQPQYNIKSAELSNLAQCALNILETPTQQCRRLNLCLRNGVAFHHAGLLSKQKTLIEDNFRKGFIKFIVSTPTLAMGVNLPAFRVIVRDLKRFYQSEGSKYIPVLEYKQFCGRAGRPQYDDFGEAILVAKSEEEAEELFQHYIKGEPEKINSKLFREAALRMHTLSLVANEFVLSKEGLIKFLKETFFGFQYQEISYLEEKISKVFGEFLEWGFLAPGGSDKFFATKLGKRISQLYIDPLNAHYFIECIRQARLAAEFTDFSLLHIISSNSEMFPLPNVKPKEIYRIREWVSNKRGQFLTAVADYWEEEYDDFLKGVKLALIFETWLEEITEDRILEDFGITPGELYGKLQIANWLLFCLQELCRILQEKQVIKDIRKLKMRLSYGIREELISLVSIRGIGRIRARRLFNAGIKDSLILKKSHKETLASLIGPKVAEDILAQL